MNGPGGPQIENFDKIGPTDSHFAAVGAKNISCPESCNIWDVHIGQTIRRGL